MIRNLKALFAAAVALAAFGAFSASGAQAAEFHCSVEPCKVTIKKDGTGKTAHHVLVIKKGAVSFSMTCGGLTGEAEAATKTTSALTLRNIVYTECNIGGNPGAAVTMNECDYLFDSAGGFTIKCPAGKTIQIKLGSCVISMGAQGPIKELKYVNVNEKKEITITTALKNLKANTEGCATLGLADGEYSESEYSTGNMIMFADGGASVWWE